MPSAPIFANHPAVLEPVSGNRLPTLLESEVRKIYGRSPLYTQRFPLHAEPLQWSCYREIPALSKKEIVERGHQAFFSDYAVIERGLADRKFEYESTGGTTQSSMTVRSAVWSSAPRPLARRVRSICWARLVAGSGTP